MGGGHRRAGRTAVAGLLLLVLLHGPPRRAGAWEPGWLTDFRERAQFWQDRLKEAWERVQAAAEAAKDKAAADLDARIDDAIRVLEEMKDGLEQVIAEQKEEWRAVVLERLEQVTTLAEELADDLEGVISGAVTQLRFEKTRLVTGVRAALVRTFDEAKAKLSAASLVDGALVSRAVTGTRRQGIFWAGVIVIAIGLLAGAVAAPTLGRRRLAIAIIVLVVAAGAIGAGVYLIVSAKRQSTTQVALGLTTCDALGDAQALVNRRAAGGPPPTAAEAQPVIRRLERCEALAADDALAEITHHQIARLRSALDGG